MKLPSKSSKLFKSIPGGRSVENYRRGATRPYVERLRRRRVVHDGSRPRRDSTEAFTSVRREIDRRVARSVASKSMGTAGTAFRTFDSWKTDGQVFSPPLPYRYEGQEEGWPCFSGEILRKKEKRKAGRGNEREKRREREREKRGTEKREEKRKEKKKRKGRRRTGW